MKGPDPIPLSRTVNEMVSSGDDRGIDDGSIHVLCMHGDLKGILSGLGIKGSKHETVRRAMEILMGLSLKGYEGRSVGAIFLIGDIEGIRRNSTQMIINPFKGWNGVNIKDAKQLPTVEAFSQLDGAIVIDVRGNLHYAGRMIHVKEEECESGHSDFNRSRGKGSGTRWRAARYITTRTRTVAITLSSNGTITLFMNGKEMGRMERRLCTIRNMDVLLGLQPVNTLPC